MLTKLNLDQSFIEWLSLQRWFRSKDLEISSIEKEDELDIEIKAKSFSILILRIIFQNKKEEFYFIPVSVGDPIKDAFLDEDFSNYFLELLKKTSELKLKKSSIKFSTSKNNKDALKEIKNLKLLQLEQSNSMLKLDDKAIAKVFRVLDTEESCETEILEFLTEKNADFIPELYLKGLYKKEDSLSTLLAVQNFIPNHGDLWSYLLKNFSDSKTLEGIIKKLAQATAKMHLSLASDKEKENFKAEKISSKDTKHWIENYESLLDRAVHLAEKNQNPKLKNFIEKKEKLKSQTKKFKTLENLEKIRVHGDYHLGQVLFGLDENIYIIDFEGEPIRNIKERKSKLSPYKDLAGMLRSFNYLAFSIKSDHPHALEKDFESKIREIFLDNYMKLVSKVKQSFLSPNPEINLDLISLFESEKAIYELIYEIKNRPDWIELPLEHLINS